MSLNLNLVARLDEATAVVRLQCKDLPSVGLVLGSGLGAFADTLSDAVRIPYREIAHMPVASVQGHAGNLVIGHLGPIRVACLQGRAHLYEGHSPERVTFGVRLLARIGCTSVLLTNAAGGIDPSFKPGDLMLIRDHLNLTGQNPLIGPNEDTLGPRFPDMTHAYDPALRGAARLASTVTGVPLHEGVYAGLLGPTYETPAEIRMLATLGASAVGMSTVHEIIALRHMRIPAAAISCITNLAAGISPTELEHAEVEATAKAGRAAFIALLSKWIGLSAALYPAKDAPAENV